MFIIEDYFHFKGYLAEVGLEPTIFRLWAWRGHHFLNSAKESIQPQVPLRLPCYDFAPVTKQPFTSSILKIFKYLCLNLMIFYKYKRIKRWFLFGGHSISRAWRAVSTRLRYLFTVACWSTITSDSNFMLSSCREQSELRRFFRIRSSLHYCFFL